MCPIPLSSHQSILACAAALVRHQSYLEKAVSAVIVDRDTVADLAGWQVIPEAALEALAVVLQGRPVPSHPMSLSSHLSCAGKACA